MAGHIFISAAAIVLLLSFITAGVESIGVCYGMVGDDLPPPNEVIDLYKSHNIKGARFYAPNEAAFESLRNSGIEVIVDVGGDLYSLASDPSAALSFLQTSIHPFAQDVDFRYIAVGNELIPGPLAHHILPAMQNMLAALRSLGLHERIKISTAVSTAVLGAAYPPSAGQFSPESAVHLNPIVEFLDANAAPLLANVYPYFSYVDGRGAVSLDYALFAAAGPVVFDGELRYENLFDGMVDAVYSAVEKAGGGGVGVVVSESGWPSAGGEAATPENAERYLSGLIRNVERGTPKRPGSAVGTFIFAFFDENEKEPQGTENHYGLFRPNKEPKYSLSF